MAVEPEIATVRGDGGPAVAITPMRRRHLRAVLRIEHQVYARPWSGALFRRELGRGATRVYVVARIGRTVVGYAGLMMTEASGHVTTVAVHPHHRRRQIGTRLLLAVARAARTREADRLTLEVRVSDHRAQDLYRKFGFEGVGTREGYYIDTHEDAIVMAAPEIATDHYAELLDTIERAIPGASFTAPT